jgi:hypothetical protein
VNEELLDALQYSSDSSLLSKPRSYRVELENSGRSWTYREPRIIEIGWCCT